MVGSAQAFHELSEKKADAMREATFTYRDPKNLKTDAALSSVPLCLFPSESKCHWHGSEKQEWRRAVCRLPRHGDTIVFGWTHSCSFHWALFYCTFTMPPLQTSTFLVDVVQNRGVASRAARGAVLRTGLD
jgi:hypothetical protein